MVLLIILAVMAIGVIAYFATRKTKYPKAGGGGSYQEPTGGKGKDQNEQRQVN